jgi:Fuc2NAc and GlcNAc transferase
MSAHAALVAALALGATIVLTPLVRRYAIRRGLVDRPGPRRSHRGAVPRAGGLAIVLPLVAGVAALGVGDDAVAWMLGSAVLIAMLGLADDHRALPVGVRLASQFAMAAIVVMVLGPIEALAPFGQRIEAVWLWTPLAVVAVVWVTNLFNFMDGADGLAAAQAAISAAVFAVVFAVAGDGGPAGLALITAAVSLGFLAWNRPRARIFLGDTGSLLLGWCMAMLALAGALGGAAPPSLAFIVVSPFVVDATLTLAWRAGRGAGWYTPHRDHAYQYLIRAGWSHGRVLLLWIALNVVLVLPAAALAVRWPEADLGVAAAVAAVLTGGWYVVHFVLAKERVTG